MLYPSIKTLLTNIDNRYLLVNVAAKRAREVAENAEKSGIKLEEKAVKVAIGEIADGKVIGVLKEGQVSSVGVNTESF